MPEADDHGMAEVTDAVGKRAQIAVVTTCGDHRDRDQGGIPLQDRDCAVLADRLRERGPEGFPPAAVIPDEVRLPPDRPREICDRLIGPGWPGLIYAQVRGRGRRQGRRTRRGRNKVDDGEDRSGSDRDGNEYHQAGSHAG